MSTNRDKLKEIVKTSSPYKRYRKILKNIESQLDLRELEQEIKSIHFTRTIRNLKPTEINQKNMIEAALKEVQGRARLVEIKTSLLEHKMNLKEFVDAVKKYLYTEFQVEGLRTKTDKKDYFVRYFRGADRFLNQLEYLLETIDSYVEDIDQAGYKFTNLVALLEMIYQKERTI